MRIDEAARALGTTTRVLDGRDRAESMLEKGHVDGYQMTPNAYLGALFEDYRSGYQQGRRVRSQ